MSWWGYILVFIAGACVGAVVMGICAYDKACGKNKWWEDDDV